MDRSRSPSPTSRTPTSSRNSPRTTAAQSPPVVGTAQGRRPEATTPDNTTGPIDQPLPHADANALALVGATPSQDQVLSTSLPVQQGSQEKPQGFDATVIEGLLAKWPSWPQHTTTTETTDTAPSPHTVATAAVQNPFLFEQLPSDLQQLVLGMLLGHPEQLHETPHEAPQEVAQLRCTYGRWLRVNKHLHQLTTQHFRERVLLCTLRIPPTSVSQLLALPIHHLLGINPVQMAPIEVLQRLTQALCRLSTDEQACQAALTLGRQLLQALCRPGITTATQRALLCVPQLIVRALRARLRAERGNAYAIACTLKELMQWSVAHGPSLALPMLLELLFTVAQLDDANRKEMLASAEVPLHTGHVEGAVFAVCAQQNMSMLLTSSIYLLVNILPNPWKARAPAPPADHAIDAALNFLANYPYPFIGFAREALLYLHTLPLNGEQQALMLRCLQRLEAPLQGPQPTPEQ